MEKTFTSPLLNLLTGPNQVECREKEKSSAAMSWEARPEKCEFTMMETQNHGSSNFQWLL